MRVVGRFLFVCVCVFFRRAEHWPGRFFKWRTVLDGPTVAGVAHVGQNEIRWRLVCREREREREWAAVYGPKHRTTPN